MANTSLNLTAVFGADSKGDAPELRATSSGVRFVRSQDELSVFLPGATGRQYTAIEALRNFGFERLLEVAEDGSCILARDLAEPSRTLRERRESLGVDIHTVAGRAGVDESLVMAAENPKKRTSIRNLERIAEALGLDPRLLTFEPGAGGDGDLAVRLKSWGQSSLSKADRLALAEAAWVIATEHRLQSEIEPGPRLLDEFKPSSNYGSFGYPVYEHAAYLASATREHLGYDAEQPIPSMRDLCYNLRVPLVRTELSPGIAGATVVTGSVRGIVVNSRPQAQNNVWVQRATMAHELGHLLWDPKESLKSLQVDEYASIEALTDEEHPVYDDVEARANAFAVELMAPQNALKNEAETLMAQNHDLPMDAVAARLCEQYGMSVTAMSYHLWNALEHEYARKELLATAKPSDSWNGTEQFTDDIFAIAATPISRRGRFAWYLVRAEEQRLISNDTAAAYLCTDVETYNKAKSDIISTFA